MDPPSSTIGTSSLEILFLCVLSIIRREWVKRYLLGSSFASDLNILTSNKHLTHTYDGSTQNAVVESLQSKSPNLFGQISNWVLLPSFNFNELSATLLIIEEHSETNANQRHEKLPRDDHPRIQRFVQDCGNGMTLGVLVEEKSSSVEVVFVKPDSTNTHRKRVLFRCRLSTFHSAISKEVTELIAQLELLVLTQESRMCSHCYTPGKMLCSCQTLKPQRTQYPFDFSTSIRNMMLNVGCFVGTYNATMFGNVTTACSDSVQSVFFDDFGWNQRRRI